MAHLRAEELTDLAEATQAEASFPHLQSCESCRRQLADLRAALHAVDPGEVPEPSPLFWDHFSARVREAVAAEPLPGGASWFDLWARPRLALACLMGACAIVAVAAAVSMRPGSGRSAIRGPAVPVVSVAEEAPDVEPIVLPDDPSLDLVADLAAQAGWDIADETGLETHQTTADNAIRQLTAAERRELQRLLSEELKHTGA